MNKKKILILGSDFSTIEVVKAAQKRKIYTIVTDLMEKSPTKEMADEVWNISTTDIDALEKQCIEKEIDGVMFGASDFNINNARLLCKRLKLPIYCSNDKPWKISNNKYFFKEECKKIGIPIAQDYDLSDNFEKKDLDIIKYPVVVKPSDKSGNRGMSFCSNEIELIEAYNEARKISDEKIIVEKQINGDEFNIHYVVANSESTLLYMNSTHNEPGYPTNIYSFKITSTKYLNEFLNEMDEKVKSLIKEIGCKDGIVWFDIIRGKNGTFYFLEMGYRFGGVMTYLPYESITGFSTINWMLDISLGIKHKKEDLPTLHFPYNEVAGSYHLFSKYECSIERIEGIKELINDSRIFIDMPKRVGDKIRKNACIGLIGIYGKNIDELCLILKKVNESLKIINNKNQSVFIKYDDYETLINDYYEGLKKI